MIFQPYILAYRLHLFCSKSSLKIQDATYMPDMVRGKKSEFRAHKYAKNISTRARTKSYIFGLFDVNSLFEGKIAAKKSEKQ